MTQPEVAILIVTYNSRPEVATCLTAALRTGADVLVIDNASTDGTQAAVRTLGVRLISNQRNLGFAAAVNQGVCATTAPCLLLLNPDAVIAGGIEDLVECFRDSKTGAAGGKLLSLEGVPQMGFNVRRFPSPLAISLECLMINRLWPRNLVNWRYRCLDLDLDKAQEVDQPAGAFLMFRRDAWQQLGGFDEGYFPIWFEDVDFCKRLRDNGFRVRYRPKAVAYHKGAHSIAQLPLGCRTEYWYRSLLRYSVQQFGFFGRLTTCVSVLTGFLLRALFIGAMPGGSEYRGPEMLRVQYAVARLAIRSLWSSKLGRGVILGA
jgi:GT2 family glycosyltransferase